MSIASCFKLRTLAAMVAVAGGLLACAPSPPLAHPPVGCSNSHDSDYCQRWRAWYHQEYMRYYSPYSYYRSAIEDTGD